MDRSLLVFAANGDRDSHVDSRISLSGSDYGRIPRNREKCEGVCFPFNWRCLGSVGFQQTSGVIDVVRSGKADSKGMLKAVDSFRTCIVEIGEGEALRLVPLK